MGLKQQRFTQSLISICCTMSAWCFSLRDQPKDAECKCRWHWVIRRLPITASRSPSCWTYFQNIRLETYLWSSFWQFVNDMIIVQILMETHHWVYEHEQSVSLSATLVWRCKLSDKSRRIHEFLYRLSQLCRENNASKLSWNNWINIKIWWQAIENFVVFWCFLIKYMTFG